MKSYSICTGTAAVLYAFLHLQFVAHVTYIHLAAAENEAVSTNPYDDFSTISAFSSKRDLNPTGKVEREIVLRPGLSVIYICATSDILKHGDVSMYPEDPDEFTLPLYHGDSANDDLTASINHRSLYRSDKKLINKIKNSRRGEELLILYPKDTIVMARNPSKFSLNFACKYTPNGNNGTEIIRRLKVTFLFVYPMAYGCESGFAQLFMNTVPIKGGFQDAFSVFSPERVVYPEPGKYIGIYCKYGEKVHPDECLTKYVYDIDGKTVYFDKRYFDPTIKHRSKSDRFALFRVPEEGIDDNVHFGCACIDFRKKVTRMLVVTNRQYVEISIPKMVKTGKISPTTNKQVIREFLYPGKHVKLVFYVKSDFQFPNGSVATAILSPADPTGFAYVNDQSNTREVIEHLSDIFGTKGFHIDTRVNKKGDLVLYNVTYRRDAVLVMKLPTASIMYKWNMQRESWLRSNKVPILVHLSVLPTDPYTYGCGVESTMLFRKEHVLVEESNANENASYTKCVVNAHLVSPIGFYCPKGMTMEPPDCFTHMIRQSTDEVVAVSDYIPYARAINGNHIRVIDTSVQKVKENLVRYSDETLICRCYDMHDVERATIHVNLNEITTDDADLSQNK
ncbi:hypothetical protein BgAZ_206470 [Babesia gibsoni]|uniref:6-Cys domain-containing protein n=1 Tax=Babesia gibsoni TaxID=33632 RepID=A0AAD8LRN9_BABGI|nr:hypothetical protein BgAZ_206470 [Babesia gibsoni]